MHYLLGLTFDLLAFDLIDVTKHGLSYTTLLKVCSKENLYLLCLLLNIYF
jgi:hypothetical protein